MMVCAYELASGRITTANLGTKGRVAYNDQTEGTFIESDIDLLRDYISSGSLMAKTAPAFSFDKADIDADGIDTATISGIPPHTLVTWPDGEVTEINDGVLEFAVDLAGTYTFTIDSVAHLIKEVSIEALATA